MRKIFFVLLLVLISSLVSAVEFDMKDEFYQGETLMAKVSGNFIDSILEENIFFYRGHVRVPMEFEETKINNDFYIYAQLFGKSPNNYSIVIKDTRYIQAGQIIEEDIVKNFSIIQDMADFSIEPGFVVTESDFFIEVQNLQDYGITVDIDKTESPVDLKSGETKKINFNIKDINNTAFQIIEFSTQNLKYEVPVYIGETGREPAGKEKSFRFEPSVYNISMSTDSDTTRIIYLYNNGDILLENISLSISDLLKPYVSFSIEEIEDLEANKSMKIILSFSSDADEKSLEGQITAKTESLYVYSAVFLNFIKDYQPFPGEEEIPDDPAVLAICSEMNGKICSSDESCDGETESANDGNC